MFDKYGENDFFLVHLLDETAVDRPGPTTFGLLVEDLDASHRNALAAGATELTKPQDAQGMPRYSAVKDPRGNWIWLYQGWSVAPEHRCLRLPGADEAQLSKAMHCFA